MTRSSFIVDAKIHRSYTNYWSTSSTLIYEAFNVTNVEDLAKQDPDFRNETGLDQNGTFYVGEMSSNNDAGRRLTTEDMPKVYRKFVLDGGCRTQQRFSRINPNYIRVKQTAEKSSGRFLL